MTSGATSESGEMKPSQSTWKSGPAMVIGEKVETMKYSLLTLDLASKLRCLPNSDVDNCQVESKLNSWLASRWGELH